ncbi:MAG: anti-sigma factor [Nitriliruptoraceae bacterium]
MSEQDDMHTWTGAYVLDALPEDERERFEAHIQTCATCAEEVRELQETTSRLSGVLAEEPPPGLRDQLLAAARHTPQEASVTDLASARRRGASAPSRASRLTAVAAGILAIAVAGLGYVAFDLADRVAETEAAVQESEREVDRFVELLAAPDADVVTAESEDGSRARVVLSAEQGQAVVVTEGLPPAPSDRTYQLWLINADGATPAGLFDTEPDGRAATLLTGDLAGSAAIGVTLEPAGGSPQPTTDPVLAIELG